MVGVQYVIIRKRPELTQNQMLDLVRLWGYKNAFEELVNVLGSENEKYVIYYQAYLACLRDISYESSNPNSDSDDEKKSDHKTKRFSKLLHLRKKLSTVPFEVAFVIFLTSVVRDETEEQWDMFPLNDRWLVEMRKTLKTFDMLCKGVPCRRYEIVQMSYFALRNGLPFAKEVFNFMSSGTKQNKAEQIIRRAILGEALEPLKKFLRWADPENEKEVLVEKAWSTALRSHNWALVRLASNRNVELFEFILSRIKFNLNSHKRGEKVSFFYETGDFAEIYEIAMLSRNGLRGINTDFLVENKEKWKIIPELILRVQNREYVLANM